MLIRSVYFLVLTALWRLLLPPVPPSSSQTFRQLEGLNRVDSKLVCSSSRRFGLDSVERGTFRRERGWKGWVGSWAAAPRGLGGGIIYFPPMLKAELLSEVILEADWCQQQSCSSTKNKTRIVFLVSWLLVSWVWFKLMWLNIAALQQHTKHHSNTSRKLFLGKMWQATYILLIIWCRKAVQPCRCVHRQRGLRGPLATL